MRKVALFNIYEVRVEGDFSQRFNFSKWCEERLTKLLEESHTYPSHNVVITVGEVEELEIEEGDNNEDEDVTLPPPAGE